MIEHKIVQKPDIGYYIRFSLIKLTVLGLIAFIHSIILIMVSGFIKRLEFGPVPYFIVVSLSLMVVSVVIANVSANLEVEQVCKNKVEHVIR